MCTLHEACQKGDIRTVLDLLKKINVNIPEESYPYYQPIQHAVSCGHYELVKLLLEQGANRNVVTSMSQTLLHLASHQGHLRIVRLLINQYHLNINVVDQSLNTPLHLAVRRGNVSTTAFLLEKGANIEVVNESFLTPIHIIIHLHQTTILELFLQNIKHKFIVDKVYQRIGSRFTGIQKRMIKYVYLPSMLTFLGVFHPRLGRNSNAKHLQEDGQRLIPRLIWNYVS
jgi:ankyrin repeat protein